MSWNMTSVAAVPVISLPATLRKSQKVKKNGKYQVNLYERSNLIRYPLLWECYRVRLVGIHNDLHDIFLHGPSLSLSSGNNISADDVL